MNEINVDGCLNCPFLTSEYDDWAVGHSTLDKCTLSMFLDKEEYIVSMHDNYGPNQDSDTPKWCPLIENSYLLKKSE